MSYTPRNPPANATELSGFLAVELQKIAQEWSQPQPFVYLSTSYVEPSKPREGMIVKAAAPWNPGRGDGEYIYTNGAWQSVGSGWRDLTAPIDVRGVGVNDPTFAVYTGTTMRAYQFSAGTMNEVFFVFHVPHDWVPGTDIYFHAHWSNAAAAPNTGNVVWKFDYQFAKGFGQEAFPAIQTAQVIAACPATRYLHNVSETTAVTIATMEVDGLILVRGYRDAGNVLDTCTDAVFLHTMDIHYQSNNSATANKAPNFYG